MLINVIFHYNKKVVNLWMDRGWSISHAIKYIFKKGGGGIPSILYHLFLSIRHRIVDFPGLYLHSYRPAS